MASTSKSQQKLFGWALACKNGDTDNCPANVKKLADTMSKAELEKYASTSHKGLPDHVEESVIECISEMDSETLTVLEESTLSIPPKGLKPTDSGDTEDNKVKMYMQIKERILDFLHQVYSKDRVMIKQKVKEESWILMSS